MKRLILFLMVSVILVLPVCFFAGCSVNNTTISSAPESETIPSATTTQIKETTEIPIEDQIHQAPAIEGANISLADANGQQKIIYLALEENPYNVPEGTLLGEYRHFVYVADQQAGGVTLAASVIDRYLNAALDSIPSDQPRWLLTLPADLSDCSSDARVLIDRNAKPFADKPYFIRISVPGEKVGVINILGSENSVVVDRFPLYDLYYIISQKSLDHMKIITGEEMSFLFVIAALDHAPSAPAAFQRGDRVGYTADSILAGLSSVRGPLTEHDYDCILMIDGCPVFMMASDKLNP